MTISRLNIFPIAVDVMNKAKIVDFGKSVSNQISSVHYFLERHTTSLSLSDRNELFIEFSEYQLLNDDDNPETVWMSARDKVYIDSSTPADKFFIQIDVIWAFLISMKNFS